MLTLPYGSTCLGSPSLGGQGPDWPPQVLMKVVVTSQGCLRNTGVQHYIRPKIRIFSRNALFQAIGPMPSIEIRISLFKNLFLRK